MKILKLSVSFIFLMIYNLVSAQELIITGRVSDDESRPMEGATIVVYDIKKKDVLKATFADSLGQFSTNLKVVDSIKISITFLGYEEYSNGFFTTENLLDLGDIRLKASSQALNEVSVTAQKQFVVQKMDRFIVYPEALISNAGLNTMGVLEKAPGILIDMNGNITYKGKTGFQVFLNDKPSYLSGENLANYLRSMPSSSIDRIEFMDNPPAKYDAAGNAGIINIVLKKANVKGTSSGINLSFGQGKQIKSNNSLTFNLLRNKLSLTSAIGYNINHSQQDLTIKRFYYDANNVLSSTFVQNSVLIPKNKGLNGRLGLDYQLNAKTSIGVNVSGFYNPSKKSTINASDITDKSGKLINQVNADIPMDVDFRNRSFNVNSTRKLNKKGSEISINYDQLKYDLTIDQVLKNEILDIVNTTRASTILNSKLPSNIAIKSIKADYVLPLEKGGKLEMGVKSSYVNTQNVADFSDLVNGIVKPNYTFSNNFNYDENINAGYVNLSKDYAKFSYQLGLRIENTNIDGLQFGNPVVRDSSFTRKYTNPFPTVFLQYRIDSLQKHVLAFSVGRRIDRPNYKDMNPFTYPLDSYTLYGGNPFLRPTFAFNTELTYTWNGAWNFSMEYNRIKDVINETNEQAGTTWYSRPGNFEEQTDLAFSISGAKAITPKWTLQFYGTLVNTSFKSKIYTESINDSKWYTVIAPVNQIVLGKNWNAELAGNYQSAILSGQFVVKSIWSARMGLSKKILNQKGTLKFNLSDMFYTNQVGGDIRNIANASANWFSYLDTRVGTISFSYNMNKGERIKSKRIDGADTEKNRVKS